MGNFTLLGKWPFRLVISGTVAVSGESAFPGNLNIIQIRFPGNNNSYVLSAPYDIQISRALNS